jgi:hypothetical protein
VPNLIKIYLKIYAVYAYFSVDAKQKLSYSPIITKKRKHNMPIDLLAAFVGVLAALQGLSMLLTNLEVAAKQIAPFLKNTPSPKSNHRP